MTKLYVFDVSSLEEYSIECMTSLVPCICDYETLVVYIDVFVDLDEDIQEQWLDLPMTEV